MKTMEQTTEVGGKLRVAEYKGFSIWRNSKTVEKHNPISGHAWTENIPLKDFYIGGGKGIKVLQTFRTIDKAKEHIEEAIR